MAPIPFCYHSSLLLIYVTLHLTRSSIQVPFPFTADPLTMEERALALAAR